MSRTLREQRPTEAPPSVSPALAPSRDAQPAPGGPTAEQAVEQVAGAGHALSAISMRWGGRSRAERDPAGAGDGRGSGAPPEDPPRPPGAHEFGRLRLSGGERSAPPGRPFGLPPLMPAPRGVIFRKALPEAELAEGELAEVGAPAPASAQRPLIRRGSTGDDVAYAQERLNAHGADPLLAVDGIFGPLTQQATIAYQQSHALDPDGIIGPRTWASLEGPHKLGGQSGGGGGAVTPGPVMQYDTTGYTLAPPAPGLKMADIRAAIEAKQRKKPLPDLGPTIHVKVMAPGTDEELFVYHVLYQLGERSRWNSEVDVVTAIGYPPKGGGNAPVGQITVQIDANGNATAELLNKGPVAAAARFTTIQDAEAALKSDFGFAKILAGDKSWTLAELNKVHAALSRMPAADRAALRGVDLVRKQVVMLNGESMSGLFSHSTQMAADQKSASRTDTLSLADKAFANDDISFVGGKGDAAKASFETILHEAGHAVETKALRDARFANATAHAAMKVKFEATSAAVRAFNAEFRAATAKARGYNQADQQSCAAWQRAINAAIRPINALGSVTAKNKAEREKAAQDAITARDAEQAKLAKANAKHPALADFADTVAKQNAWLTAAKEQAAAKVALDATRSDVKAAEGGANQSKRLKNFVDLVNKHKIPPLTAYAKQNWPAHPDEFYAEAYSLYLNDRSYLAANAKPLVDWFDRGDHLK